MPLFHFHRVIVFCCLLNLFLIVPSTFGQSKRIGAYEFRAAKNRHTVRVVVTNASFDSSKHNVDYVNNIGNIIDGHVAYGAEAVPRTQIKSIVLYFDGRRVKVPRFLYANCYNPNLEPENLKLRFEPDLQTVFVTMEGADGAGAYIVVWALRRHGRHSRSFKPAF